METGANKTTTEPAQLSAGCDAMVAREKRFGECGLEEKIERLRNVLRATEQRQDSLAQLVVEAHDVAHDHSHEPSGRVMRAARDMANKLLRGVAGRNRSALD